MCRGGLHPRILCRQLIIGKSLLFEVLPQLQMAEISRSPRDFTEEDRDLEGVIYATPNIGFDLLKDGVKTGAKGSKKPLFISFYILLCPKRGLAQVAVTCPSRPKLHRNEPRSVRPGRSTCLHVDRFI